MVKRYDLEQPDSHMGLAFMKEESHGDWVRYEDHRLAVARAYQRACDPVEANFPGTLYASNRTKTIAAILLLADTDPLAEVQALKAEVERMRGEVEKAWASRERTADERDEAIRMTMQNAVRAEAAEAEVARLREALMDIADPHRLQSLGDPAVLRDRARAALQPKGATDV